MLTIITARKLLFKIKIPLHENIIIIIDKISKIFFNFLMGFFTYKVSFEITYFCQFGESLMVLGNIPELGIWDFKNGLKLQYKEVNSKNASYLFQHFLYKKKI